MTPAEPLADELDRVAAAAPASIPWVEGALLRFFAAGPVLDIKDPSDPDGGPVIPGASIAWQSTACGTDLVFQEPSAGLETEPTASFQTVFSRDALALARDPPAALRAWFALVDPGGHLIVVLPAASEPPPDDDGASTAWVPLTPLPQAIAKSSTSDGTRAGVSKAVLTRVVQAALPAGAFRIVLLGETPARRFTAHGEARDLRLVLRKIGPPSVPDAPPAAESRQAEAPPTGVADLSIPFASIHPNPIKTPGMRPAGGLLVKDFAFPADGVRRILVLKLDHHGDFIIALPALRELRTAFPDAHIRLVCGKWNVATAWSAALFDDVRAFDYFPERAAEWTGVPVTPGWSQFAAAVEGHFDVAIDLRVDEDTRSLLGRVDARLRCGIGSQARFPLLDIVLPDLSREPAQIALSSTGNFLAAPDGAQFLAPDDFVSEMEVRTPAFHEGTFRTTRCLLQSAAFFLPEGAYEAVFELAAHYFLPGLRGVGVKLEVVANREQTLTSKVFGRRSISQLGRSSATLRFESAGKPSTYEFRVMTEGRPLSGRLRFGGMRLRRLDANGARFSPSEMHVGEKLSLLVTLVRQRALPLSPSSPALPSAEHRDGKLSFVIAPFSNSTIRDWPMASYAALIDLLAARYACRIRLVGSPAQTAQAAELMNLLDDEVSSHIVNSVGQTKWSDLPEIVLSADLVLCNNSGIAHQAAALGAPTLALYSASHQPMEWGPRGQRSRAVMMSVACSPCGYERIEDCVNDHLCMRLITPPLVMGQVESLLKTQKRQE